MSKILLMTLFCVLFLSRVQGQSSVVPFSTFSSGYGELSGIANDVRGLVGQVAGRSSALGNVVHSGFMPGTLILLGTVDAPLPQEGLPEKFDLAQNYPNPFNPSTTIKYQLTVESFVTLKIYDVLGREVATLMNETQPAGRYSVVWNATNDAGNSVGSGFYLYRLQARSVTGDASFVSTKKMIALR